MNVALFHLFYRIENNYDIEKLMRKQYEKFEV